VAGNSRGRDRIVVGVGEMSSVDWSVKIVGKISRRGCVAPILMLRRPMAIAAASMVDVRRVDGVVVVVVDVSPLSRIWPEKF
jgi:hypothetical protein